MVCRCGRRVSYQFDEATLRRHLLVAAVHLLLLLMLGGHGDLPLCDDVVLGVIILGGLGRVGWLLTLVHYCLRRHLLLGSDVQRHLSLHLTLEVLVEDAKLVAIALSLLVLLAASSLPLYIDVNLTGRSCAVWLGRDAALGGLARGLLLLLALDRLFRAGLSQRWLLILLQLLRIEAWMVAVLWVNRVEVRLMS